MKNLRGKSTILILFFISLLYSCTSEVRVRLRGSGDLVTASEKEKTSIDQSFAYSISEADIDTTSYIRFNLEAPLIDAIVISVSTLPAYKALIGVDYLVGATSVEVSKGAMFFDLPVTIIGDILGEGDETFTIVFESSDTSILSSQSVEILIEDNDPVILNVNPFYPVSGANWNDFVSMDANRSLNKSEYLDNTCLGMGSRFSDCINGAKVRKVVATGQRKCADLTMEDQLGVFEWKCSEKEDPVYFYSQKMHKGKGLADLVEPSAFKNNKVILKKSASVIAQSNLSSPWWANIVQPLILNSGGADIRISLDAAGVIYTVASSGLSRGIDLNAKGVSLVGLSGATITATTNLAGECSPTSGSVDPCLIHITDQGSFSWFESNLVGNANLSTFDGGVVVLDPGTGKILGATITNMKINCNGAAMGIRPSDTDGVRIRQSSISNCAFAGIYSSLLGFRKSLVEDSSFNNNGVGISSSSWRMTLRNIIAANNVNGLHIRSWVSTLFNIRTFNNAGYGLSLGGADNIAAEIYSFGNQTNGFLMDFYPAFVFSSTLVSNGTNGLDTNSFSSGYSLLSNSLVIGNATGLNITTDNGIFSNNLIANNNVGVNISAGAEGSVFNGELLLGGNTTNCTVNAGPVNPGLLNTSCDNQGASSANKVIGVDTSTAFVGAVVSDSSNTDPVAMAAASITDWTSFENFSRGWARVDGGLGFPLGGNCVGGVTCQIWDFKPTIAEANIFGKNGSVVNGEMCPLLASGSLTRNALGSKGQAHAIEIWGDEIGNDNILCESNESCLFLSNIGAYQGEGTPTKTCVFEDGVVTGVKMYGY